MDEELNVSLGQLLDHALELIRRASRLIVFCLCQLRSRNYAVSNLYIRDLNHFLAYLCLETQVELRNAHLRYIVERASLGIFTTITIVHGLAVLFSLLTYVGYRLSHCFLAGIF